MSEATLVHRGMLDAINARDLDALRRLMHEDYSYTGPDGREQRDPGAGIAVLEPFLAAFPDMVFEVRTLDPVGEDRSVVELTARGTQHGPLGDIPATGRSIDMPACNIIEVRDGRIVREREYFDSMVMLAQLGVLPTTASV